MLAPLRDLYLQPKGFVRRTRGRIPESTLAAWLKVRPARWVQKGERFGERGRGAVRRVGICRWMGGLQNLSKIMFLAFLPKWISRQSPRRIFKCLFGRFLVGFLGILFYSNFENTVCHERFDLIFKLWRLPDYGKNLKRNLLENHRLRSWKH